MAYADPLKSGRYSGVATNPYTGRRFRTGTFASQAEAVTAAEQAEAELWAKVDGTAPAVERTMPTLADYGPGVIANLDVSDSTRRKYAQALQAAVAHFGLGVRLDEITPRSVIEFRTANQTAGLSHSWASLRMQVLRQVMNAAIVDGYRGSDPTYGVKVRNQGPVRKHREMLTDEELHQLGCLLPEWFWVATLISHDCGLRISEVCALKRTHVNVPRRTLLIKDAVNQDGTGDTYTKGRDETVVYMSERLAVALNEHVRKFGRADTDYLFCDPADGRALRPRRLSRAFERARVKIGRPDVTWHVLRHGCAQALIDAGAPEIVPQVMLRHKSAATTAKYIHSVPSDVMARWVADTFDAPREPQSTVPPLRVAR